MAVLKRLTLKGFRSIKDTEIDLCQLNVFIGANGAGKSNLISFFKMLSEMMGGRLQQYIATTGRAQSLLYYGAKVTSQVEATLEFKLEKAVDGYGMRLFHAAGDTVIFAEEELRYQREGYRGNWRTVSLGSGHSETRINEEANRGDHAAEAFQHLLNQCRVYHFHDTSSTARVRGYCYVGDNRFLMPDAGNMAAMLFAYKQSANVIYQRIVSTVKKIVPEFDDFVLEPDRANPRDIALNWCRKESDYVFGPHQFSDGSIRAIAMATLFLQPENDLPAVIVLDEPELGLHPHALEIVAGLIRAASLKSQVIIATQSMAFLDHFNPSEIIIVESNGKGSQFRRLDPDTLKEWLEDFSIGELWKRNVLGGGPLT